MRPIRPQLGPASTPSASTTTIADTTTAIVAGSAYATKAFSLPLDVTLPLGWFDATPTREQPNFVTWESTTVDRAVRFLIPVNVYPPGGTGPTSTPPDYLHYLLAQTDHGAHFADQIETTVGGKPATIVTATVDNSLDGSLGCPDTTTPPDACFGLQPDLVLRIAVVDTGTTPLLIWLRGAAGTDMTADKASFAELLTTIRFSDRPVQAPTTTTTVVGVATPLDGTYRWTLTAADAMAHGMPEDKTPEGLATFPRVFTVTMHDGRLTLTVRDADGSTYDDEGTYTLDDDRLLFHWSGGAVITNTVRVDPDGTLHLTAQDSTDPGGVFVMTTKPWTRIAGGTDTTPTVLDGTYRWTITKEHARTHGLPQNRTPEGLADFPSQLTMTMTDGQWTLHHDGVSGEVARDGTYTVDGDHVRFDWNGNVLTFAFSVDADGTLHLDPQSPIDPGDAFIWATEPWTRIAGGTGTTATVLDGTYRWTLTENDALTHGLPQDRAPEVLATYPSQFTMTMDGGTWQLANMDGQRVSNPDAGHGSYTVAGDHVVFHEAAEVFTYTFSVDPDGTLHLVAQPPINPGPAWVFATNPWTKID